MAPYWNNWVKYVNDLEKAADIDDGLTAGVQRLSDHLFGLEDVTETLRAYLGNLDTQANRLESVEVRLDLINKIEAKTRRLFRNAIPKA
jgi:DNA repair protein RecN (Recombination protein N)